MYVDFHAHCTKKGFFIGYMVQRLCTAVLGRAGEDDRDHYGKKRLDMIGMLMRDLFKTKFGNPNYIFMLHMTQIVTFISYFAQQRNGQNLTSNAFFTIGVPVKNAFLGSCHRI